MPFTTLAFAAFFAALFLLYYGLPRRFQWWLLLVGSMVFYGYASLSYLTLLWGVVLVSFAGTRGMACVYARRDVYLRENKAVLTREEKKTCKAAAERCARRFLVGTVLVLLLVLGAFKYTQFFLDNLFGGLRGLGIIQSQASILSIILPVGLSFYVFQTIGYCIDVYREEVAAERNIFRHALFVSLFAQLLQGPIGRLGRLAPQLFAEHVFDYRQSVFGLQRILWGVFKKFVIANAIANQINPCWTAVDDYPGLICWAAILVLYAIQLYADFSGYMDIACGSTQMLGVKLDENFSLPYFAKSIPDFWRRWHMSLSAWFKDYLFYPILRSDWNARLRKRFQSSRYWATLVPTSVALAIVWAATGLWHGASWGYVAWGVYYGVFMIANLAVQPLSDAFHARFPRLTASRAYGVFQIVRTFAIVVVGYSIFKPADLGVTWSIWSSCRSINLSAGVAKALPFFNKTLCVTMGLIFLVDAWHFIKPNVSLRERIHQLPAVMRWGLYLSGMLVIVYFGYYGARYDQFEYFKF